MILWLYMLSFLYFMNYVTSRLLCFLIRIVSFESSLYISLHTSEARRGFVKREIIYSVIKSEVTSQCAVMPVEFQT
jgi:hypothetical protein